MAEKIRNGVVEFQKKVVGHLAQDWECSWEQARDRIQAWLKDHPNPNSRELRDYRPKSAEGRDANIHRAVLKKQGGIDRGMVPTDISLWHKENAEWDRMYVDLEKEYTPEMPEETPRWVTE